MLINPPTSIVLSITVHARWVRVAVDFKIISPSLSKPCWVLFITYQKRIILIKASILDAFCSINKSPNPILAAHFCCSHYFFYSLLSPNIWDFYICIFKFIFYEQKKQTLLDLLRFMMDLLTIIQLF